MHINQQYSNACRSNKAKTSQQFSLALSISFCHLFQFKWFRRIVLSTKRNQIRIKFIWIVEIIIICGVCVCMYCACFIYLLLFAVFVVCCTRHGERHTIFYACLAMDISGNALCVCPYCTSAFHLYRIRSWIFFSLSPPLLSDGCRLCSFMLPVSLFHVIRCTFNVLFHTLNLFEQIHKIIEKWWRFLSFLLFCIWFLHFHHRNTLEHLS